MIIAVIVPIFLLLALGYLSVRCQILKKEQVEMVGAFVIKVALPLLFFQFLASKDLHEIWYFEYFAIYTSVTLLLYGFSFWLMRRQFKNTSSHSAVLSLGAAMSNTGLIGTAVLTLLVGQHAMTYTSFGAVRDWWRNRGHESEICESAKLLFGIFQQYPDADPDVSGPESIDSFKSGNDLCGYLDRSPTYANDFWYVRAGVRPQ